MEMKSEHKDYCENYNGTLSELAHDIGGMTHDARAKLFSELSDYVNAQYNADLARGRVKYAEKLKSISNLLKQIKDLENDAWEICKSRTQVISK